MDNLATRLESIHGRIAAAARQAGRQPSEVQLVAVSKTHPAEVVREAFEAGQPIFGENKVQEILGKAPLLPSAIRWHLIGHLQKNKIRKILPQVELIHGVDSVDLARDIDRIAADLGLFPRALLEVNVSGEASKFGFQPDTLKSQLDEILALPRLQVEGLMTIAPYVEDPAEARPFFAALRILRDDLASQAGIPFSTLSMGMSGDFEIAIEEGATLVRVGSAIFGARPKKSPDA